MNARYYQLITSAALTALVGLNACSNYDPSTTNQDLEPTSISQPLYYDLNAKPILNNGGKIFTQGVYLVIIIPTKILFTANTAHLTPKAISLLKNVVNILQLQARSDILIAGHTSGISSIKSEQQLSEKRALQVATYLTDHGINNIGKRNTKRKLQVIGYGSSQPITNRYDTVSIQSNSRIQITAYRDLSNPVKVPRRTNWLPIINNK